MGCELKISKMVFTSDAVAIAIVNLFDGSIPEGKLPHPVDSAADARRQAQTGIGSRRVKTVRSKVVITISIRSERKLINWGNLTENNF